MGGEYAYQWASYTGSVDAMWSSPLGIWQMIVAGGATLEYVWASALIQLAGGLFWLWRAQSALEKNVARADLREMQPKVRSLFALKRSKDAAPGAAGSIAKRGRRGLARVINRWKATLVGGTLLQTNLFAVLLPIGLFIGMGSSCALLAAGSVDYWVASDSITMATAAIMFAVLVGVAIESASTIAREKARHTGEVLATTPAGGARMLAWKGAAVFAGQLPGILALGVFWIGLSRNTALTAGGAAGVLAEYFALLVLAYAVCVSFSLAAATPASAMGWTALVAGVLPLAVAPMLVALFDAVFGAGRGYAGPYYYRRFDFADLGFAEKLYAMKWALGAAFALILARNRLGRFALAALAAGCALALGALAAAADDAFILLSPLERLASLDKQGSLGAGALMLIVALAAALLAGACPRFDMEFLKSAARRGQAP